MCLVSSYISSYKDNGFKWRGFTSNERIWSEIASSLIHAVDDFSPPWKFTLIRHSLAINGRISPVTLQCAIERVQPNLQFSNINKDMQTFGPATSMCQWATRLTKHHQDPGRRERQIAQACWQGKPKANMLWHEPWFQLKSVVIKSTVMIAERAVIRVDQPQNKSGLRSLGHHLCIVPEADLGILPPPA